MTTLARLMLAGLSGDTGKSLVSIGLVRALRERGHRVAVFKKGPDFIDAAWLSAAAGQPARNLDTFMMQEPAMLASLAGAASTCDLAIIEGNRGLFDGLDAEGTHSSAELAKRIGAPVVLVLDATKVTRTLAAHVLGCRAMDADLPLAGVILNRVATARQERLVRDVMRDVANAPVLGAIPHLGDNLLPSRQLGLITPVEHDAREVVVERLAEVVAGHVDVEALRRLAEGAPELVAEIPREVPSTPHVRIGLLSDRAFSFYYPENLAALEHAGATLVPFSPLLDETVPSIDALYGGGGFPERYAAELSANESLRGALARCIVNGLPVWAECGALMYLSLAILRDRKSYPMVGALPAVVEQTMRPRGHGYVEAQVDGDNPFLERGLSFRGHEFHYSQVVEAPGPLRTVLSLARGTGIGAGRDGLLVNNVVACYTHIHALGVPAWAPALVRAASHGATD